MVIVTDRDLAAARRLPDEFVKRHGPGASARITELVGEHWKCYEDRARAGLAEALLPVLAPLLEPGANVTDRDRGVCEAIVAKWMDRDTEARIFADPDRGAAWQVSSAIHADGRFRPVFKREAVSMWAQEELTSEVDALSHEQLRRMWSRSRREITYKKQRWWVRWEERPDLQTWTWFEAESGGRYAIKAWYPFPFVSEADLSDALENARIQQSDMKL